MAHLPAVAGSMAVPALPPVRGTIMLLEAVIAYAAIFFTHTTLPEQLLGVTNVTEQAAVVLKIKEVSDIT
jgi:hypothetical protein